MTTKHTEVFLVRHGQTDSNVARLLHGSTDVPLNALGERQAALMAQRVAALSAIHSLHSSPLRRALSTATAIANLTGMRPALHSGLSEFNFGEFEGLTVEELEAIHPEFHKRMGDPTDHDVAFPGGESRKQFHNRVRQTLDQIVTANAGERLVVVAHGGVIASVLNQVLGGDPYDWRFYNIKNCSVTHLEFASKGPIVHVMDDVVHLEALDLEALEQLAEAE